MQNIDVFWVLFCASLVFMMQAGFTCLETGLTRAKNNINVAIKNLANFIVSFFVFGVVGFGIIFGQSFNGWFGDGGFMFGSQNGNISSHQYTLFIFQSMFCAAATTILSGAVAERMRFDSYIIITLIVSGLIYPVFAHWVWNSQGWLQIAGFRDFAGSTVVHAVGGLVSLASVIIIGAREGRFNEKGESKRINGSNIPMSVLGVLLLWIGWMGFNGGSTMSLNNQVPEIILNTFYAGVAGAICTLAIGWFLIKIPDATLMINGSLVGMVSITASCNAVQPVDALIIGSIGGVIVIAMEWLLEYFKLDDAVSAIPVHLGGGIWGTIAVAIFGDPEILKTGLDQTQQLMIQLKGILFCSLWSFVIGFILIYMLNIISPIRVSPEEERVGLNVSEHGEESAFHNLINAMDIQAATGDTKLRAPVEPFTEAGKIAEHYNLAMDTLEKSEETMKVALKQAEEANNAKSEFLTNMTHELRTPMHAILGYAQIGINKSDKASKEKIIGYFDRIQTSGKRLLALINSLLDLAKFEAGRMELKLEKKNLADALKDVLSELEILISDNKQSVVVNYNDTDTIIEFDYYRIIQVLNNLLSNAIKFSPMGSKITISFSRINFLPLNSRNEIRGLSVAVSDEGFGIPENEINSIFDKFTQSSRTRSNAGGTGIGLAVCKEIIEKHHGKIWAQNNCGKGSSFIFVIPASRNI